MKKVCLFLFFFFCPLSIYALNYDIENYFFDVTILNNGDVRVKELIVYDGNMSGIFHPLYFKLNKYNDLNTNEIDYLYSNYYNATGIKEVEVSSKLIDGAIFDNIYDNDFVSYQKIMDDTVNNSQDYVYLQESYLDAEVLKIYYEFDKKDVGFLIEYTIADAIIIHNDVAEFYWQFIDDTIAAYIPNVSFKINLPYEDNSSYFNAWFHGSILQDGSSVNKLNNQSFLIEMKKSNALEDVVVRTVFDKSLITDISTLDKTGINSYRNILILEENLKLEEQAYIEEYLYNYNMIAFPCYTFLILFFISVIYLYFKYDKERKRTFSSRYYRVFIDEYDVAVAEYLIKRKSTINGFSASILNLIYKKNISAKPITKKENEYEFALVNTDNISESEYIIITLLFNKIGKNNKVTSKQIELYSKSISGGKMFLACFDSWKDRIKVKAEALNFYESNKKTKNMAYSFFVIAVGIMFYAYYLDFKIYLIYVCFTLSVLLLLYSLFSHKKTVKGLDHYYKWKGFKNFLNDFGNFDDSELPEMIFWEKYLVYATAFGLANKVENSMRIKMVNLHHSQMYLSFTGTILVIAVVNILLKNIISLALSSSSNKSIKF